MRLHRLLTRLALVAALGPCVLSGPASASLLAYEGFGYPAGANLNGQNGGPGWAGAWATFFGPPTLIDGAGLAFGSLAVTQGAAATPLSSDPVAGNNIANYFRTLASPVGADNTTLYVSLLLRPEANFGFYGGLNLGGFFIGKSGPVPTYSLESGGGNIASSSTVAQQGETVLLVLRAQFLPGDDIFSLFVNPVPGAAEPLLADATMTNFDLGTQDGITINNASAWTTDEIRFGSTFADVTPAAVPAPSVALLVAGGLVLVGLARRRGRRSQR